MRLPIDRQTLLKYLPKGVAAEVGVARGVFSQEIIKYNNPKQLYLIDVWKNIDLEYVDINMVPDDEQQARFELVQEKFAAFKQVVMMRMTSTEGAASLKDSSLDWVFIDADHSYRGCLSDLRSFDRKVSNDGYICGHDWLPEGFHVDGFGVNQAVEEFISENRYILSIITSEPKYQSYVISKNTKSHASLLKLIEIGEALSCLQQPGVNRSYAN